MSIVSLSAGQVDAAVDLAVKMHSESELREIAFDAEKVRSRMLASIGRSDAYLRAVLIDDEIAGLLWGGISTPYWTLEKICTDAGLYVAPEHRSSGIAKSLLKDFEFWAKMRGVNWMMPGQTTGVEPEKVRGLYEHLGYTTVGFNVLKGI